MFFRIKGEDSQNTFNAAQFRPDFAGYICSYRNGKRAKEQGARIGRSG